MIEVEPIGWWNTGFPFLVLAFLALVMPRVLLRGGTRSQGEVAVTIWASAGVLLIVGAVVFGAVYAARGVGVWAAWVEAPGAVSWFFLRLSALAAMLWAPVLALVWFAMAQGVEKRRGEDQFKGR